MRSWASGVPVTRETRRLVRALAASVVGQREDAKLVQQVLQTMLQTAILDFRRYYEARHAANRIADTDILIARNKMARAETVSRRACVQEPRS